MVELYLNKQYIKFKIHTGADITVIPASVHKEHECGSLKPSNCHLNGANQQPLQVIELFTDSLSHDNMDTTKEIFVIEGLSMPLVGRPAISALKLVAGVTLIQTDHEEVAEQFSAVQRLRADDGRISNQVTTKHDTTCTKNS